jgi:hypothetical protein
MSFLNPLALVGLALLSLPVIVHLLTMRRARRLDFPTLRYLRETPSFRLHPRRIRQPLLLALRLLALLLLTIGIARPLITRWSPPRTRLILIDASLSMNAPGRAAAAQSEARAIINRLAEGERAAVISFSSEASVLAAITADREALLAAVLRYQPGSGAVDFREGFAAAAALLAREAPGTAEIDLISDFQKSNLAGLTEQLAQLPARVRPHAVGAAVERNAFLLDEAVWQNSNGLELSAAEIVSAADGRSGARRNWTLNEGAGKRPDLVWRTEANGQITGRLRAIAPDDFDADDERFFAFTPPREARVLLIETDAETNLYMGAALESAANGLDKTQTLLTRQRQLPTRADELNAYALVALTLHGALRAEELALLTEYAKAGGHLWLSLARDADTTQLNALAATDEDGVLPFKSVTRLKSDKSLSFGAADLTAPPLCAMAENTFQALRAVNVREGYAFETRGDAETLMRWSNGTAAFVSARVGGGKVLLLGTSTESAASDMGSSPAFPSLAFSLLREAAAPRETLSYDLGAAVDLGLAPSTSIKITDTDGHAFSASARDLIRRPLSVFKASGIYRLESEKGIRFVALNPPREESERALAESEEVQLYFDEAKPVAATSGSKWREAAERGSNAWRYFLGAALLLLLAELFIRVRQRKELTSQHEGLGHEQ